MSLQLIGIMIFSFVEYALIIRAW